MMEEQRIALMGAAAVGRAHPAEAVVKPNRTKPNSFYKGQEIKRLMKQFIKEGVSKARARELAKIWYNMSPEQRREVMNEKA